MKNEVDDQWSKYISDSTFQNPELAADKKGPKAKIGNGVDGDFFDDKCIFHDLDSLKSLVTAVTDQEAAAAAAAAAPEALAEPALGPSLPAVPLEDLEAADIFEDGEQQHLQYVGWKPKPPAPPCPSPSPATSAAASAQSRTLKRDISDAAGEAGRQKAGQGCKVK